MNKDDLELLYEVGSLRLLQRTIAQFHMYNTANITEHTVRVMWIALLIAKYEKNVNQEKLLKMCLVHDLGESRTGDVNYLQRQYVVRNEALAIEDMFKNSSLDAEFVSLWKECEAKETLEAQIAKDADNLDVDLEFQEQNIKDNNNLTAWIKIRAEAVYPKLYTKAAKKLFKMIYTSNPHDWHLNGRNRFRGGDWKKDK